MMDTRGDLFKRIDAVLLQYPDLIILPDVNISGFSLHESSEIIYSSAKKEINIAGVILYDAPYTVAWIDREKKILELVTSDADVYLAVLKRYKDKIPAWVVHPIIRGSIQ